VIHSERDRKLESAREERRQRRQAARQPQDLPNRPAAETKPPDPTPSPPAAWVDFRNLRQSVTLEQVLRHLGYLDVLRGSGPQRRGPCPLHDQPEERFRSFSVNLAKNVFQCFHAPCRAAGNTLDLWAAVHRLPLVEAARHLAETFHLPSPSNPMPESEKTAMWNRGGRGTRVVSSVRWETVFLNFRSEGIGASQGADSVGLEGQLSPFWYIRGGTPGCRIRRG